MNYHSGFHYQCEVLELYFHHLAVVLVLIHVSELFRFIFLLCFFIIIIISASSIMLGLSSSYCFTSKRLTCNLWLKFYYVVMQSAGTVKPLPQHVSFMLLISVVCPRKRIISLLKPVIKFYT